MKKLYSFAFFFLIFVVKGFSESLYIVGRDAAFGDWSLGSAAEMTHTNNKYVWIGDVNAGTPGNGDTGFKFLTTNTDWIPAYVSASNGLAVSLGEAMALTLRTNENETTVGDNKFVFSQSGKYKIEVELGTSPTMTVTRLGDYGELYMVGTATAGGWDLNNATKMTYTDGKYTWVGDLISGNGNDSRQLKFITSNGGFYPAFVASVADKVVDSGGGSYKLLYCEDGNDGDNKFKFSSGKYKIEVELGTSPTMTVTRLGDYGKLYMVGDAVSGDWEPGGAQEMTYADGKYTWKGQLSGGEFKFLTTNTGLLPSYVSADADPGQSSKSIKINSESQKFNLKYRDDANAGSVNDYNFKIDGTVYSGEYEICVEVGTNPTVTITKQPKADIPDKLYINGDIAGWDATKSIEMTTDGNPAGVFTWSGSLPHGELKFLTVSPSEAQSGTNPWFPCYVATNGLSVVRKADNSVFEMNYRTEGTQNDVTDYKFFFYKGEYTLTVNLNGETPKLTVNGTIDNLDINTNELSLIGNAVVGSRAKFTPVPCNGKRVFVYTGKMKCGQTNTFRFAWEPNEWPGMVAMGGQLTKCTFDVPMSMVYIPSDKWENAYDWRFYIDGAENEVRDVVIRINIMENVNDMTMTITGKAEDEVNYNFSAMYDNTSGKNIIIDGVEGDYSVTYMNGELISGTNDYTNDLNFTVPCNGIYVVKANCISKKVLIY